MARVIDAKYSTLIGTPKQLRQLLDVLRSGRGSVVDLKFSNFVVLDRTVGSKQLCEILETTPRAQRA